MTAVSPEMPITEDWLKHAGFKWHQLERQPHKHWLLWLGDATAERHSFTSYEDIGIELAPCWWKSREREAAGPIGKWFCWLRDDSAGRYHRCARAARGRAFHPSRCRSTYANCRFPR